MLRPQRRAGAPPRGHGGLGRVPGRVGRRTTVRATTRRARVMEASSGGGGSRMFVRRVPASTETEAARVLDVLRYVSSVQLPERWVKPPRTPLRCGTRTRSSGARRSPRRRDGLKADHAAARRQRVAARRAPGRHSGSPHARVACRARPRAERTPPRCIAGRGGRERRYLPVLRVRADPRART